MMRQTARDVARGFVRNIVVGRKFRTTSAVVRELRIIGDLVLKGTILRLNLKSLGQGAYECWYEVKP